MPVRVIRPTLADRHVPDTDTRSKKALRSIFGFNSFASTEITPTAPRAASPTPSSTVTRPRSAQSSKEKEKFNTVKERTSVDVADSDGGPYSVSLSYSRQSPRDRDGRASVTDISFFQQARTPSTHSLKPADSAASIPDLHPSTTAIDLTSPAKKSKMTRTQDMPYERARRRKLVRIDAQEGPWSVSVAESPYDRNNYSIYIKTLTHHMTLTRSSEEILALHRKLISAHPELTLPDIPLQNSDESMENGPADKKRKTSFLHTLSRFASPGPNRRDRPKDMIVAHSFASTRNSTVSGGQAEASSVSQSPSTSIPNKDSDTWDPYASSLITPDVNSALSTALAGYLTTLANEPALKQSKAWRRFVRIRADDLISERIERAVKRVRSDLAAHLSAAKLQSKRAEMRDDASLAESAVLVEPEEDKDTKEARQSPGVIENIKEEEEEDVGTAENISVKKGEEIEGSAQDLPGTPKPSDTARTSLDIPESVSTPTETNATIASRIPRSQSADPDKATRMSRIMQTSPMKLDDDESAAEYESEAQVETEVEESRSTTTADDDSSVSTTGRQRKPKRSKSARLREKEKRAKATKKVVISDFDMMRVLGKGCAGKVLLVRHRKSENIYALKAITKRHVLAHQELQHTLTEQAVLKRMAREGKDPFVVKLWWSFHDRENLYLVMDFHPGGDLATQLARWGRLGRDRARFYAAEIVEGVDGLHAAGVIYRDLKPENILIGADGHIVLTDFGLSKEFPRRTSPITAPATPSGSRTDFHAQQPLPHWMKGDENNKAVWPIGQSDSTTTFCGTAEYLAPEVIQGEPYSYEVDWWSFGTMLYEMLTGITPFWAENHAEMYCRVLRDELKFPNERVLDQDTKSLIRGLLQRNPALRIKQPRIKRHPYFSMIDWSHVYYKRYIPPYIPPIDPLNASDTQNFDDTFLDMAPVIDELGEDTGATSEKTDGEDAEAVAPAQQNAQTGQVAEDGPDLFDGYSFKGRHSVLIDDGGLGEFHEEGEDEDSIEENDEEDIQRLANADIGQGVEDGLAPSDEVEEPKTPEARKPDLPELTPAEEIAALHRAAMAATEVATAEDASTPVREVLAPQPSTQEEKKPEDPTIKDEEPSESTSPQTPVNAQPGSTLHPSIAEAAGKPTAVATSSRVPPTRGGRPRREKSGIHALDKDISDAGDDEMTERDEDDDWDFVEALPMGSEDRNGPKGTSLFARGVVDRYRLAVFRKSATPSKGTQRRNISGISLASDMTSDTPSPSPSDKQRRGRNQGLTFRRNKQLLKNRSPPPSAYTNGSNKILTQQKSIANTVSSATSSSAGILSPASSLHPSTITGPSLKSKESTMSVGSPSSDDQSINGDSPNPAASADVLSNGQRSPESTVRTITTEEPDKPKSKKLKRYKEGAEKMLSIFASPR